MNPITTVMNIPELWHKIQTYALNLEASNPKYGQTGKRLIKEYKENYRCYLKSQAHTIHPGRWFLRSLRPSFHMFTEIDRDHAYHPNIYGLTMIPLEINDGFVCRLYVWCEDRGGFYNPKRLDLIKIVGDNALVMPHKKYVDKDTLYRYIYDARDCQ